MYGLLDESADLEQIWSQAWSENEGDIADIEERIDFDASGDNLVQNRADLAAAYERRIDLLTV